ncbi:unnamed protein product [Lactuca virosa]|uniref:Nodulation signaling pathway 1-like protein n=1 Tax=Lactuca virosa TaxID=75947 RepID=A0AAU9MI36_9ASTR|nr:unnamed protein product [Lactuca virosa]
MIKQDSLFLSSFPLNTNPVSETMLFGEPDPYPDLNSGQIMDWLEESLPYLPSLLDDLYDSTDNIDDPWWAPLEELEHDVINANTISTCNSVENLITTVSSCTTTAPTHLLNVPEQPEERLVVDLSKKRKATEEGKRSGGHKKGTGKATKDNCNGGKNDGRWAEQLLNPCAAAITAGNVTRVQHLLFVLHELASPTGDANYRLASHGLQALLHHLSSSTGKVVTRTPANAMNFTTATPKFFQRSLINFNDINPWFTIPFNIANNAILQVLSEQVNNRTLHILDIGVSHGFQWPTLLEALSHRPGGPPPLVRLTVVPPENRQFPFANCPPGYDFTSNILRFAKDVNVNLQINTLDDCPLNNLNPQIINSSPDETLIVCAQFRLHDLNHHTKPDNRTEFLKLMRSMNPQGVILSDNNMGCSCKSCSSFDAGFSRSLDYLWRFLDSTSVAFKGREMEERKVMEGEAAKALVNMCEMNETKEKWGERMRGVGFVENAFGEDAMDQARALLKKYDSHWEMRVEEKDESIGLRWKGQSVSFCSLWKIDPKTSDL